MAVGTDGSINSAQVKQMERGLETHTANIAVLTEDNVALKTDNVALRADSVALKAANTDFVRHTNYIPARSFWDTIPNAQDCVSLSRLIKAPEAVVVAHRAQFENTVFCRHLLVLRLTSSFCADFNSFQHPKPSTQLLSSTSRQATEIARQAAEIVTLKKSAGEQKVQTPKDTVDESTGIVTASGAFCAVSTY